MFGDNSLVRDWMPGAARLLILHLGLLLPAGLAHAAAPDADSILASGKFEDGIAALQSHLKDQPKDDVARFGLGAVQFVHAVQSLGQKLALYGLQSNGNPDLARMFGETPAPAEPLTYPRLRQITQEWVDDLARVELTLAKITAEDVKLPLHVARVSLTLARSEAQALTLVPILQMFSVGRPGREIDLVIAFDRADVDWMRGYCHLLSAVAEISLAYDAQELFDVFAHRVFHYVRTPHPFLLDESRTQAAESWFDFEQIIDLIAAVHVLRFPVLEAKRMPAAMAHLQQTLVLSRQMWKRVLGETDDDREWIPGPGQRSAINVRVTAEMIEHWTLALDETEAILQGKKLLPFWRGKTTRGVNLRRVFLEPGPLDLVLWIQGSAATPYLDEGELTSPDTWEKINEVFQGQFLAFGAWFN